MITINEIQTFVSEIVAGYNPEKVYLFGSYANNTATEDSDIDLFIIKNTTQRKVRTSIFR